MCATVQFNKKLYTKPIYFKFLGELENPFFQKGFSNASYPHSPDCSVRLMMSSWSERERVVKSAL